MPHLALEYNHFLDEVPVEKLQLLSDRILARVITKPSKAKHDLRVVHWEYDVKTLLGRILRLGDEYAGSLHIGDYVIFGAWKGREFRSPKETLILLHPQDIEAIVERDDTK